MSLPLSVELRMALLENNGKQTVKSRMNSEARMRTAMHYNEW